MFESFDQVLRNSENTSLKATPLKLNYQCLAGEIMRVLRGPLKQRQLSRMLGFTFNQVGKWESGVTQIKWEPFVKICQTLNIPIEQHFRHYFWTLEKGFDAATVIKALENNVGSVPVKESTSTTQLKKWIQGHADPDLSDVLQIMGNRSAMLFGWLSLFLDCQKLPSLAPFYRDFTNSLVTLFSDPLVVYVNSALQLKTYQDAKFHDEALLAEHATCSVEKLRSILNLLVLHDLVQFDGIKYQPSHFDFSFSGMPHPKLRTLAQYTLNFLAKSFSLKPLTRQGSGASVLKNGQVINPSIYSVRVAALSPQAAKKIMELISKFHSDVGDIVSQDHHPKQNVQVIFINSNTSNINSDNDSQK